MDAKTRNQLAEELHSSSMETQKEKGDSYAGKSGDALSNFKRNAENLGLTKYQVWAVYFGKHVDSISNAIKHSPELPKDDSEGLRGRIIDAKNYLDILYCLLIEDGEKF